MSRQTTTSAFHKSKTLEGKYMLGDEIGKGAYGRVYKGLDLENGDFVAIKQVSLENIAQEDLNIIMQEIDLLKVIEMSGVCAASDIWSVGCTVIELLTCVPPYYDLQPMPALFRIVQDEHPPIPDSLSPAITDFLRQCFKKDARQRPDAKTLLSHPWIQNSRRALQTSLRHSGTLRNTKGAGSEDGEVSNEDDQRTFESSSTQKESNKELTSIEAAKVGKSAVDDGASIDHVKEKSDNVEDDISSDQVPTLAIHQKSQVQMSPDGLANHEAAPSSSREVHDSKKSGMQEKVLMNGDLECSESKKKDVAKRVEGKGSSVHVDNGSYGFGPESPNRSPRKVVKASVVSGENELSKFRDSPGDASLDDLFHPLDKSLEDRSAEASTSASSSLANQGKVSADSGKNDLATKLRATIAQKRRENEPGQANGGDLLRLMMGVLKEEAIDIEGI